MRSVPDTVLTKLFFACIRTVSTTRSNVMLIAMANIVRPTEYFLERKLFAAMEKIVGSILVN